MRRASAARSISLPSSTSRMRAIGPREGGGFGLAVKMRVEDKSLPQADLASLVKEAHEKICPYSHATRGNVDVTFDVVGA
jgi:organic hydroperoxide reductase OsmC/OhrA